jgi:Tfp pilus assembly protein PilN
MNLLPSTEKEALKKGLKLRFITTASFLSAAFFLAGFIMLLPSYFLILENFSENKQDVSSLKIENGSTIEEVLNLPNEIEFKLKLLQSNIDSASVVDSFSKIIQYLPQKVKINSVSFLRTQDPKGKNSTHILISGVALDRDSLASFSNSLKTSKSFSSVDVPVSSLAKDKNLPFSINISMAN